MTYLNSTGRMEMNGGVGGYGYGAGSYGMGSGQANPYYAYEQQLLQYISQVRSALSTLQQGSTLYNQYSQYLNTA